jgi:hypothetical protein
MRIAFGAPFEHALSRTKRALFSPFDLGKWFTVGFTAFLADIVNSHNGGGGGSNFRERTHWDWEDFLDFPGVVVDWFADNPGWFMLCLIGLVVIIAIVLLLVWLSSRGKFMFLHNVANDESQVSKPWGEYGREANSLFLWRVAFGLICLVPVAVLVGLGIHMAILLADAYYVPAGSILVIIGLGLAGLALFIAIAYIDLFLDSFVVPIMYRERVGVTSAWARFLSLFSQRPWHFILYGLMVFFLHLIVGLMIFIVGLLTCCIGFLLLIIPYIGSVVTLPISYVFRAFSLEFLEQFGPEYKVFK